MSDTPTETKAVEHIYVQQYPEHVELCSVCGQPDNCGDCNHVPLEHEEVVRLGGSFVLQDTRSLG